MSFSDIDIDRQEAGLPSTWDEYLRSARQWIRSEIAEARDAETRKTDRPHDCPRPDLFAGDDVSEFAEALVDRLGQAKRNRPRRRFKYLAITRELLVEFFRDGASWRVSANGLPKDAEIAGISEHERFDSDEIVLKIRSDSYPEVDPDGPAPYADHVQFTRIETES